MKNLLFSYLAAVLVLSSCSSGKSTYEQGNYYDAVITSVNRLRRNTDHKKSVETLRQAYPLAVTYYQDRANTALASSQEFKWTAVVQSYTAINTMYDEIRRCPGALAVVPDPVNYFSKLQEARQQAAGEHYNAGVLALQFGTRDKAKQAYGHFKTADEYAAGYKDVVDMMEAALLAATVKIQVDQIPVHSKTVGVSAEFFNDKISEFVHSAAINQFVRFYSPQEIKTLKISPDHIIQLAFDDFTVGQVLRQEREIQLRKDSVVMASYVTPGNQGTSGGGGAKQTSLVSNGGVTTGGTRPTGSGVSGNQPNNTGGGTAEGNRAEEEKKRAEKEKADRELAEKQRAEKEQADREFAAKQQAEKEKADRELAAHLKAERAKAEQELAARLKAEREQAELALAAQLKAQREQAEKELADKLKADREKAEKEAAAWLQAEKEKAQRELADKALEDKLKADKEKADMELAAKIKAEKEAAERALAAQQQAEKEKADRELAEKLKAEREQAEKALAEKLKAEKEKADRELAAKQKEEKEKADRALAEKLRAEREAAEHEANRGDDGDGDREDDDEGEDDNDDNDKDESSREEDNGDRGDDDDDGDNDEGSRDDDDDDRNRSGGDDDGKSKKAKFVDPTILASDTTNVKDPVTICHRPPGNNSKTITLKISRAALKAHLGHGDTEGSCADDKKIRTPDDRGGQQKNKVGSILLLGTDQTMIASRGQDAAKYLMYPPAPVYTGDTTKVYGTVKATLFHFRKTTTSRGTVSFRIVDAKTGALLSAEKMPGEFVWVSEWATFNGDERALSAEQLRLTKLKEMPAPPPQDLFIEFTKPIYEQITGKIRDFYKNY